MATITITTTGNALGQYCVDYSMQINQMLKQSFEFEQFLPFVSTDHAYQGVDVTTTNVLQPYQKAFTPNNDATFDGQLNTLNIGKIDLTFDWLEMEKFFDKWRCNWFEAGKPEDEWSFPRYMIENAILPQFNEDVNLSSYNGVYAAPTPGTPGAYSTTWDGFKTSIAAFIVAGDLTPIVTGAFVSTTAVQQFKDFCAGLPLMYRDRPGTIFCSKTVARMYAEDFQAKNLRYVVNINDHDNLYAKVDTYNKRIVGLNCMEGSERLVCVFDNLPSMIIGTRRGYPIYPELRVDVDKREINFLGEFYRFYGYETLNHLFVNDQA